MLPQAPGVLADPAGVVADLVAGIELSLDRASIEDVVARVAGGRAKRRRLARALLQRPLILTDGRSPAPRVAGDLLIALRHAGAVIISPPVCAGCGRQLRTLQRRGEDWYCGACGPSPEPCAGCGLSRPVCVRDRAGRPRCLACRRQGSDPDPAAIVAGIIAVIDPGVLAGTVTAAVHAAAPRAGQLRRLAWALQDHPELLTGAGARAPVPSVLRLIGALADAGAQRIVRPACPHCGRVIALVKPRDGVRLCRNCVARSRAETCSRCGVSREPAARDGHGRPLCPYCLISDPANLETCVRCARRRVVSVRTPSGPLCPGCRQARTMVCSICARLAPAEISKITGEPWCRACQKRRACCAVCGSIRLIRGGTLTSPLCATCARPDPSFWHSCPGCGARTQHLSRRCARCSLLQRLEELLSDGTGAIHPRLQALHDNLAGNDRPDTVLDWLNKNTAAALLRELAAGERPLTHAALDELPDSKTIRHLRSILVATGALASRDEHMIRLECWITTAVAGRRDHCERQTLHRYATWHAVRRLRRRADGQHITHNQAVTVQRHVRAAITLLDWLTSRGLDLAAARQGDLDTWLASDHTTHHSEAGNFVRWARRQKLTSLDFAASRWDGPTGIIDTEARWHHARRLLHDTTIKPEDRVAGLLLLLYAQGPAAISRLTIDHIHEDGQRVRLRLGHEPIVLPEPLAALVLQLTATRHGHAALGDQGNSRWLFPGGQPGRPISAYRQAERLRQLGLRPGPARSTALFALATELPAALLARLLGIHISVAVAWQRASSGDWATYAADYSRRQHGPADVDDGANPVLHERHSEGCNI